MPTTQSTPIKDLSLDLNNYRTVPQPDEVSAVQAMISISPDYFWGLMESMLADEGYLPTENILVLDEGTKLTVREGNRRIAVLKIIHDLLPASLLGVPDSHQLRIKNLSPQWLADNANVPCAIYTLAEASIVDRIVTLAHGKGDKASRDKWNAVARARHSRDVQKASEPGLDILEKYVAQGKNLTSDQAKRWAGDYPLTVLDEAIKKIYPRLGATSTIDLAKKYPVIPYQNEFDSILLNIGFQNIKFGTLRSGDFASRYGIPQGSPPPSPPVGGGNPGGGAPGSGGGNPGGGAGGGGGRGTRRKPTQPMNDPRTVIQALKKFKVVGPSREKVASLRNEAQYLDLEKNPIAFCFLLRSMFEISAKAYCDDQAGKPNAPKALKNDGSDRNLVHVLRDIYDFMVIVPTTGKPDPAIQRQLHGAITDLASAESILSVTSMNQLVHNPRFAIRASDISIMFHNIFPLLEAMNK